MVGVRSRALVILGFALATACGARHAAVSAPATSVAKPASPAEPVYRFVSLGVTYPSAQQALGAGRIGVITNGWPGREIVNADGSVEVASPGTRESLMGAVPVPARLGGGFMFWDDVLYRARSFNGPLEPIAALPTNEVGLEFGPDYLLLLLPDAPPRAFALDPPHPVPLSPKGVLDVVASDDGRALALDAAGRALASIDTGKTWKDVTSALGARVAGVREEGDQIAFTLRDSAAWLQPDGQFVQRALPKKLRPGAQMQQAQAWRQAVMGGLPLPGMRAWVGEGNGTHIVDLRTGVASVVKLAGPEGSNCIPVSLDEEGLVVCTSWKSQPSTTVISHALGSAPLLEKTFTGTPQVRAGKALSVMAHCSGASATEVACVRRSGGVWSELRVAAEVLKDWQPLFWVPRETGGVALIVGQREVPEPKIALLDLETNRVTPWDTTLSQVSPSSASSHVDSSFMLLADGSLRGYTLKRSIVVDAKGHVTPSPRSFAEISSAGEHALARDNQEHLWQSKDYGLHWLEIARPPSDVSPDAMAVKTDPRPSGRATRIDCSLSGCALEHPSGTGVWLRLGWPEDVAAQPANPNAAAQHPVDEGGESASAAPPLPTPPLPQLRCAARSSEALRVTNPPRAPTAAKVSAPAHDVLGSQRALGPRAAQRFAHLAYRDVFAVGADFVSYGLRAAAHLEVGKALRLGQLPRATPVEVLFVEPFDFSARVRRLSTSTRDWSPPNESAGAQGSRGGERAGPAEELDFTRFEGVARPLLGSDAGRAAGVLLLSEPLSLFAANNGPIQPIVGNCAPVSGYVNARGQRFVACADPYARTRIQSLEKPQQALVRAPLAARYRDEDRAGLHFFPPGEPVFVNPDAIAVARDGTLRILRLPPGDAPPTIDNPAWLVSGDADPVALAPWSTIEVATSPACAGKDGYRAIVQTRTAWLDVPGRSGDRLPGMTALVRWSAERVCLEAVEVGVSSPNREQSPLLRMSAVVRFSGVQPGAAFMGTESSSVAREPATCELGDR